MVFSEFCIFCLLHVFHDKKMGIKRALCVFLDFVFQNKKQNLKSVTKQALFQNKKQNLKTVTK